MRTYMVIFILILIALLATHCGSNRDNDEALLWEYYKGFTYAPDLFDSLKTLAKSPETKDFFSGLKCFEKYSQDEKADCYDSAYDIFSNLIKTQSESYLGHLGMGLLMTEKGIIIGEKTYFDSAIQYYGDAHRVNPDHAAIYYYRGRNEYNRDRNVINENAIRLLDTATQIKPDFFKAAERSARFLSHYFDLANTSSSQDPLSDLNDGNDLAQKFNAAFPQARDRVRYLFAQSIAIDPSWYETYQDIVNAHHVYSVKERLDFLKTGILIAQKKRSKDSIQLIKNLANLYFYDLNDYERARSEYGHWISQFGGARDYVNLAWCQFFLGQPEAVPYLMQKAIELDKSGAANVQYALFFKEVGQLNDALVQLTEALKYQTNPDATLITMVERVKILMQQGRNREAKDLLSAVNMTQVGKEELLRAHTFSALLNDPLRIK